MLTIARYRPREYDSEDGPWDPISGGASALLGTISSLAMGFADFPIEIIRALKSKPSEKPAENEGSSCPLITPNSCNNALIVSLYR